MKLLINQDPRKPLTVRQVVEFLQHLDPEEEILIFNIEKNMNIEAPLTEILVPDDSTAPTFISLYVRDKMFKENRGEDGSKA